MIRFCVHGRRLVIETAESKFSSLPRSIFLYGIRNASLNSAIHKGIRRSKSVREREARPFRDTDARENRLSPPRGFLEDRGQEERVRRPNHQQGMDAEDIVGERPRRSSSRARNRSSFSERSDQRQDSSSYSTSRSSFRDKVAPTKRSEGTGWYGSSGSYFQDRTPDSDRRERIGGTSSRDPPRQRSSDRESRRAYGHRESSFKSRALASDIRENRERPVREDRDSPTREPFRHRDSDPRTGYRSRSDDRDAGNGFGRDTKDKKRAAFLEQIERSDFAENREESPSRSDRSSEGTRPGKPKPADKTPLSIPHMTASSEFLYGTSVVTAALISKRRQLFKLYVYEGENRSVLARDVNVKALARKVGVEVESVSEDGLRLMDKMSTGRPHNGYVLEASPLPRLPVVNLLDVPDKSSTTFQVTLGYQSKEDQEVNGVSNMIPWQGGSWRYPLVLLLDGVLDPGNLGAILRSAYFLGADAVGISNRNSAPLSPVTLKSSAGASESIQLFSIEHPGPFIQSSIKNGWHAYAAVAPPAAGIHVPALSMPVMTVPYISSSRLESPLSKHPCIIVLGGEAEGLRSNIRRKCSYEVGIEGGRKGAGGVDSLNVSVAGGLLCEAFLRKPREVVKEEVLEKTGGKVF